MKFEKDVCGGKALMSYLGFYVLVYRSKRRKVTKSRYTPRSIQEVEIEVEVSAY